MQEILRTPLPAANATDVQSSKYHRGISRDLRTGRESPPTSLGPEAKPQPVQIRSEEEMNHHVLVGVTGSVAALKLPVLVSGLQEIPGVEVQVVTTERAKHFYSIQDIPVPIYSDDDEWKMWNRRSDPVLHIELRRWADLMILAPLDANTLSQIPLEIFPNLVTCIVRAWDLKKPLLFCPAMNTAMWDHPITTEQIERLRNFGYIEIACIEKTLMCGDKGLGAMAEVGSILDKVVEVLSKDQPRQ
ncbi:unnamed protein product [Ranitomeya imitator]|uniref:Flavoprotein domain-containing protein n=1 Tax=Ranitomeya imitator TaxID=111125 RepID=A0ABN9MNP2_9NEOB|nr:unnamed protein product [Ranitomeya imitator]